ncbi:DeoR/GlpR family DNA-binding transcription regulator [Paenibacillus thalictri]|uniref:DeoR/GlpR transcriptional regulator n=1 Tax=Paenibacillus thalictri TaxID=2527873 RepID=A0A4Q9DKQ0_9BACL|nr:DeoR/GlpR family DNA-binding transcription regulator [Paenibacillus thalictri]TBL75328.1 DeoR/GlpR transcriptional regulator [Paenibacillus thalictri]
MLAAERWQKIVQLVNERGSSRVTELSDIFQVTEETIRRDLDKLENEGKLLRSHGGAVSVKDDAPEVPYPERETTNAEQKRKIAQLAIGHIREKERIILDASTTAWYMAQIMPDFPLTVLTNSIKVSLELSGKEHVKVISTGGQLSPRSLSFVGPLTERSLSTYHVDKAFISCTGLHGERGISEANEQTALVKQKMVEIADHTYVLADFSKFGQQSFAQVAGWDRIGSLITDAAADESVLQRLRDNAVNIIQA